MAEFIAMLLKLGFYLGLMVGSLALIVWLVTAVYASFGFIAAMGAMFMFGCTSELIKTYVKDAS